MLEDALMQACPRTVAHSTHLCPAPDAIANAHGAVANLADKESVLAAIVGFAGVWNLLEPKG